MAGSSDNIALAPVVESGMDCDVVHDEHDLKQLLTYTDSNVRSDRRPAPDTRM